MSKFRDTRLYEALDYLDEAYVAEVVENLKVPPAPGMPTRKRGQLRYILALAACLLVLSAAIPVITYVLRNYAEFPGWLVGETTADTSPELTEPETPPEVTTAPPTPETSENIYHETTAPLYHDDCTTAKPEPEYDGSRGLLYKMNEDGKSYYLAGMGICTDEDIVVASTYDGYPVTIIGEDALAGYDRVKSITIPDSVTAIDMRAFKDCTELESITIPDTVYYISGNAFMNCTSLKSIKLPKALELVNPSVFGGCTALEEIVVPDFVTEIYIMAFYKCTNLKSVTLGRRVEKLWADVFRDCENLTEINFAGTMARWNVIEKDDEWNFGSVITVVHCTDGDIKIEPDVTTEPEYDGSVGLEYKINDDGKSASLVGIGTCTDTEIVVASTYNGLPVTSVDYSFSKISHITSITLSDSVLTIGGIDNMPDLVKVYFSKSVEGINPESLIGCPNLEIIEVDKDNQKYSSAGNCLIVKATRTLVHGCKGSVIPTDGSVTIIGEFSFHGCDWLTELTIPKNIERIDAYAFAGCDNLKKVILPDSLTYLGFGAFSFCESLESIRLGNGLETLGGSVFENCPKLMELTFPKTTKLLCALAFFECKSLTKVSYEGTIAEWKAIEKTAMWSDGAAFSVVHCSDGDVSLIEYDGSQGLEYKISDDGKSASLVGIGTCTDTEIVVASTYNGLPVTSIAAEVFLNCKKLETVDLGGVSYIGASCFRSCSALRSVKGSENLVEIPACAFQDCDALVEFKFGGKLTSIGSAAFKLCTALKAIDIPASVTEIGLEAFNVCIALESVTIRGAVKSLHSRVFSSCSRLKSVKLSTGLESITDNAFEYCTSLKGIDIPLSVTLIGPSAFYGCTALEEISIPEGVTSIGDEAFYNCRSLNKVTLPDTLERIHNFAFAYCESLNSVMIPDRVKRIGEAAFRHCIELSSLTLGVRVELIEDSAFKDCVALKRLHFPNALRTLEDEAFMGCTSITDISYSGNVGEWADVDKAAAWINISTENTVTCADGEVSLSMLTEEEAIEAARKFLNLPASAVLVAKDRSLSRLYCYKIAYCEYAQSVGEFEIKREVFVDQNTGECSEVVYDYPNIPEVFLDVIFNREKFLYVEQTTDSSGEYKYTTSEALFKDHSAHQDHVFGLQTLWYYVTDIDSDSIPELIFPGSARSNYGMLFRVYEGKVYGYACILDGLRTDATYLWHEQAGNYRGRSQVYFDGIFYKSRRLTEYDTNDPNNIIYYVEGKETTKEKYEEYESAFSDEELESFQLDYYPVYVNPYPGG